MSDEKLGKLWWKKFFIIMGGVILLLVIAVGIYSFVSMNNTILALNDKVSSQESALALAAEATPVPTPQPTKGFLTEINTLEALYNQKTAMLTGYEEKANKLEGPYTKDEDFINIFGIAMKSYSYANRLYEKFDSSKYEDLNMDPFSVLAAIKCACYYTYADEMGLKLTEARGIIDALKIEFSQEDYDNAYSIMNSIEKIYI